MQAEVIAGDCLVEMPNLEPESVDAVVTDPPYHLTAGKKGGSGPASVNLNSPYGRARIGTGFMGKAWDGGDVAFRPDTWAEVLRVAKPGAYLVAFGGTRTYHRLTCAIEDAGWEIRDCLMWLYGSGFPKSLDVSKAIDKAAGAERTEVVGRYQPPGMEGPWNLQNAADERVVEVFASSRNNLDILAPATDAAREWAGWGTALKPAWEPIILARKPLRQTVAANVLEHGTGAMNIDDCRIAAVDERAPITGRGGIPARNTQAEPRESGVVAQPHPLGRWPSNVLLDEAAADLLDAHSGELASGTPGTHRLGINSSAAFGAESRQPGTPMSGIGDRGGASRFFYTSKASRSERDAGLDGMEKKPLNWSSGDKSPGAFQSENTDRSARNNHPTVKPLDLMQWLCRLVTPRGGLILDPFTGSGTTGRAAVAEGFRFLGIERDPDHAEIARKRIADYAPLFAGRVS